MAFFKIIFVILLCIPFAYIILSLLVNLIDSLTAEEKAKRVSANKTGQSSERYSGRPKGYGEGDYYTTPRSSGYRGYDRGGQKKK